MNFQMILRWRGTLVRGWCHRWKVSRPAVRIIAGEAKTADRLCVKAGHSGAVEWIFDRSA